MLAAHHTVSITCAADICFNGAVGDLCTAAVADESSGIGHTGNDRISDGNVVDRAAGHFTGKGSHGWIEVTYSRRHIRVGEGQIFDRSTLNLTKQTGCPHSIYCDENRHIADRMARAVEGSGELCRVTVALRHADRHPVFVAGQVNVGSKFVGCCRRAADIVQIRCGFDEVRVRSRSAAFREYGCKNRDIHGCGDGGVCLCGCGDHGAACRYRGNGAGCVDGEDSGVAGCPGKFGSVKGRTVRIFGNRCCRCRAAIGKFSSLGRGGDLNYGRAGDENVH